jgi:HAD superfamily hydrolase (TIGR01458 family)
VVYAGAAPIAGAIDAIGRLRGADIRLRFITNTTRRPRRLVIDEVKRMGLEISEDELLTPAIMVHAYLRRHDLHPFLIIHPDLEEDFAGLPKGVTEAVVVGDAGEHFTYARLNAAFRKIMSGAPLLALALNRNFMDDDQGLSLDAGPFVTALEYASRAKAILFGKPSAEFFAAAIDSLGCPREATVMIGDDVEADVAGAMAAGIKGILVRTGKYRQGDETRMSPAPNLVAESLGKAADYILQGAQPP